MKKIFGLSMAMLLFASCATLKNNQVTLPQKSIVVLYENDVHCGIDGYAKMAGLRDAINRSDTAYAVVVSSGDFLQGGTPGAISAGQYVIDIMRNMDYAAITIGNHEFDYGVPHMKKMLSEVNAPVVCVNFFDTGAEKSYFPGYVIKTLGNKRVAFVGAVTPETMILERFAFYNEQDEMIYDLKQPSFYKLVQQAVDQARNEGADYVVLLSHVGEQTQSMGFDSHRLVAATRGIDAVLDGHSHSVIPFDQEPNIDGKIIGITQTGTQFMNIGKLVITKDGKFSTSLLASTEVTEENARVKATTDSIKALMNSVIEREVCTIDYDLEVLNPATGLAYVRCRETNAGDLVADAYRNMFQTDVALMNGGGIRNNVPAGKVTYGDVVSLVPYDNKLVKLEATGADILNVLQLSTALTPEPDGNFPQCSGIRYTIHTDPHTVTNVQVLDKTTGNYVDIDPSKTYTLAINDYCKHSGFGGALKNCKVLQNTTVFMRDALADYIDKTLGGHLGDTYAKPQGRITILP
jgi:2',3'-cyclic-nucleotide 2'-phosphodiesterase (5'-nucleotidase family)